MEINALRGIVDLDGSFGEGGGQILRTALALSILTNRPFKLRNIRVKRKNPGLAAQHLACITAAKEICNAKVQNAFIGSKEILFIPSGKLVKDKIKVNVGTAGSISLVLQTLMPTMLFFEKPFNAEVIGGTDVKHAPPFDYLKHVLLPLLKKIGYNAVINLERRGFYPKGNGKVIFEFYPSNFKAYNFVERGRIKVVRGNAVATKSLMQKKVADKLVRFSEQWLRSGIFKDFSIEINKDYVDADSDGAILCLWVETEKSVIGSSSLGELKRPSEVVAREAVEQLEREISGVIDSYAADQLLPYLAYISREKKIRLKLKTSFITSHAKTNAFVIEKFLPVKFKISNNEIDIIAI